LLETRYKDQESRLSQLHDKTHQQYLLLYTKQQEMENMREKLQEQAKLAQEETEKLRQQIEMEKQKAEMEKQKHETLEKNEPKVKQRLRRPINPKKK